MSIGHEIPTLLQGGRHMDARGTLSFVNEFDFRGVERFYWVEAGQANVLRGWVGHKREHKWFAVIHGEALIAAVEPDDWKRPRADLPVLRYTLSGTNPQVLHIPPGYATGNVNVAADTILMIFSSGTIENAKTDDFRFAVEQWPIVQNSKGDG